MLQETGRQSCSSALSGVIWSKLDHTRLQGRKSVTVNAAERQLWYPGGEAPKHLDNTLPGDYG